MEHRNKYTKFDRRKTECCGESKTHKYFKDEVDINNIMRRFKTKGILPPSHNKPAMYGDVSNVPDYMTALQIVIDAEQKFNSLPAKVRARFNNAPEELLDFCSKAENLEEMVSLGLAEKSSLKRNKSVPADNKTVPVNPETPPSGESK